MFGFHHRHHHHLMRRGHGRGGGHGGHPGFLGRFGGGGPMGGGMRAARMLSSDDLQLIVLGLLEEKPRHGYEVIKALDEHSRGFYSPSPGMIYPALTYLEELGYATSQMEGNKKLFQITSEGSEHFKKNRGVFDSTMKQLALIGERVSRFQQNFEDEESDDLGDLGGEGSPDEKRTAKESRRAIKAEFHEIKHQMKAAIFEKSGASLDEQHRVLEILKKAIREIRGK
jgi:DNA-binding PadR family transcriptional regulator